MNFRDRYAINKDKAEDGAWVDKGGDFHVLIRRLNAKPVRKLNAKLMRPYKHLGDNIPPEIQEEVSRKLVSDVVLLDWKGAGAPVDDKGKMIPYTPEAGYQMFVDFGDFLDDIVQDATRMDNFRDEEREDIKGNS